MLWEEFFVKYTRLRMTVKTLVCTVCHFSYAPPFQGPHFYTNMLESNMLFDTLFIDILSV